MANATPTLDLCTMNTKLIERIARVCHEANRAYSLEISDGMQLPEWDMASPQHRESLRYGVSFRLQNPDAATEAQHNAWMETKLSQGWVYGEIKNEVQKTHPCLVQYPQLPESQRIKDRLFCAIVAALS